MIVRQVAQEVLKVVKEVPVVNLVPLVTSVLRDVPKAWESMPEEKRQEIIQNLIIAGAKAAAKGAV